MDENQNSLQSPRLVGIIVAIVVLVGVFFLGTQFEIKPKSSIVPLPSAGTNSSPASPSQSTVSADDDAILGNVEAPVTIIEFGDYQCPFCEGFYTDAELSIRTAYVAKGLVRFVYRDFPLDGIHPYARAAAEAAQCAADQGKYWGYHDYLFEHQAQIPSMDFVGVAETLGLNAEQFKTCITIRKYRDEVERDLQDGIRAGVSGTPTTFINGVMVTQGGRSAGAAPYAVFQAKIEEILQSVER